MNVPANFVLYNHRYSIHKVHRYSIYKVAKYRVSMVQLSTDVLCITWEKMAAPNKSKIYAKSAKLTATSEPNTCKV